jgi:N-acetyl-anhydromuramyl-L-alanine amidase AmpD
MLKINNIDSTKPTGRYKNKKQIMITHTGRNLSDYVKSLKYRHNGKYNKLPHYVISRDGDIYNVIPPDTYSLYLNSKSNNKQTIIVCLENLGWLRKNPLNNNYINWIGNIHNGEIYEKKWRGYNFWQPYTETQIDKLADLIKFLCDKFNIPKNSIGHNVKVDKVENFNGITTKSNYDSESTDLNPAFDFNIFIKKVEQ